MELLKKLLAKRRRPRAKALGLALRVDDGYG